MYMLVMVVWLVYVLWHGSKVVASLKAENPEAKDPEIEAVVGKMKWKRAGIILAALLVMATAGKCIKVVDAGHRIVVFDITRGVLPTPLGEGIQCVIPVIQSAIVMDVRVQAVEFGAEAVTKDLQEANTKVTINFNPLIESIPRLYQQVGLNYTEKIIHPAVQEIVKAVTAKHTAEELITHREQVKDEIHAGLAGVLRGFNIQLIQTYITNFEFSKNFNEAIEAKQVAEQDAQKALRVLQQVRIEADQKIAKARAEAESLRMQNSVVTPMTLKLRSIEAQLAWIAKWNGVMPSVILGGNSMSMIDLKGVSSMSGQSATKTEE